MTCSVCRGTLVYDQARSAYVCPCGETTISDVDVALGPAVVTVAEASRPSFKVVPMPERPKPDISTAWTPEQLVAEFLEEIRSGKVNPANLMVFFTELTEQGGHKPRTWHANMGHAERIAFCNLEIQRAIEDWRS